jgi:hypothetical protein
MPGKTTQYHLPMHLQLVKNREEQWAAESQRNPEESDQGLRLFAKGSTERIDFGSAMEWVKVFFQVFGLSLFSGSFLLIWIFALKLVGY